MSDKPKIYEYKSLQKVAIRLRDDLNTANFVLLYAYNGTGKTRLSMEFKDSRKKGKTEKDTLYFNAYTEDLFTWDNDLRNDAERILEMNADSNFFSGFKELALEGKISEYLQRYTQCEFKIDYDKWTVSFFCNDNSSIKISRGEQNIFIWCIFLAICELVIDGNEGYSWVKYVYIDDPISSLDDNNAIAVSSDLAKLLLKGKGRVKTVVSSHHGLFYNVLCNEFKRDECKRYFLYRKQNVYPEIYTLQATDDTPFFHHVAMLSELKQAADSGRLYTHHFNMLRSIMEKTASFFGYDAFSTCISGVTDDVLYARALNLLSHGKYSVFEPREMVQDTKVLFCSILNAFLEKYAFRLPEIFASEQKEQNEL